jgi:hypothetical protein
MPVAQGHWQAQPGFRVPLAVLAQVHGLGHELLVMIARPAQPPETAATSGGVYSSNI